MRVKVLHDEIHGYCFIENDNHVFFDDQLYEIPDDIIQEYDSLLIRLKILNERVKEIIE